MYAESPSDLMIGQVDGRYRLYRCFGQEVGSYDVADAALQAAIEMLAGGGSLILMSGAYPLSATLKIPSNVTLRGMGASTVLRSSGAHELDALLIASGVSGVVIADMCLVGGNAANGVVMEDCGDCEVRAVRARDFDQCGVVLQRDCFMCRLLDNVTSGNPRSGTLLADADRTRGGDWVPNLVSGCTSLGEAGHGFEIDKSLCTNFVGCQVHQSGGHGFFLHRQANSTCITGCRVYQGYGNGIMVEDSHELNVSSNIVCWNRGHGIELRRVFWGTISANNFIDNGGRVAPPRCGIYLDAGTRGIQVSANALFNWPGHQPMVHGIFESSDCQDNQITDNTVNFCSNIPVASHGRASVAKDNLGLPEAYEHPAAPHLFPLVDGKRVPKIAEPFSGERLQDFLQQTRP